MFFGLGRGKGESEAPGGGGLVSLLKIPPGGGVRGGGGAGRVSAANWGFTPPGWGCSAISVAQCPQTLRKEAQQSVC